MRFEHARKINKVDIDQRFTADLIVPEIFTPYSQVVSSGWFAVRPSMSTQALATSQTQPDWEGVTSPYNDFNPGSCAWCGSVGAHKADCKALARNYPRSSLSVQRDMTARIREEMEQTMYRGSPKPTVEPAPKDTRTDVQKRFAAIAEELEESKDK